MIYSHGDSRINFASHTSYFNSNHPISVVKPDSVIGANCDSQVDSDSGADSDPRIDSGADLGINYGVHSGISSGFRN